MEFMRQPDEAKKIGVKWLKWHILRYPNVFLISLMIPPLIYKTLEVSYRANRDMMNGTYVPNVIRNRYAICRPDDYNAQLTPARYRN